LTGSGVIKDRPALFAAVSAFLSDAQATGFVREAIERSRIQGVREPSENNSE
jgi:hypothetical protein